MNNKKRQRQQSQTRSSGSRRKGEKATPKKKKKNLLDTERVRYSRFDTRFFLFLPSEKRCRLLRQHPQCEFTQGKERTTSEASSAFFTFPLLGLIRWCGVVCFFYPILIAPIQGNLCLYILSPLRPSLYPTLQGWWRLAYDRLGTGSRADTPAWNTHFMWDLRGPTFGHSH